MLKFTEAAIQRCSQEKLFWKYAANLQKNTHVEVWFCFSKAALQLSETIEYVKK